MKKFEIKKFYNVDGVNYECIARTAKFATFDMGAFGINKMKITFDREENEMCYFSYRNIKLNAKNERQHEHDYTQDEREEARYNAYYL